MLMCRTVRRQRGLGQLVEPVGLFGQRLAQGLHRVLVGSAPQAVTGRYLAVMDGRLGGRKGWKYQRLYGRYDQQMRRSGWRVSV